MCGLAFQLFNCLSMPATTFNTALPACTNMHPKNTGVLSKTALRAVFDKSNQDFLASASSGQPKQSVQALIIGDKMAGSMLGVAVGAGGTAEGLEVQAQGRLWGGNVVCGWSEGRAMGDGAWLTAWCSYGAHLSKKAKKC